MFTLNWYLNSVACVRCVSPTGAGKRYQFMLPIVGYRKRAPVYVFRLSLALRWRWQRLVLAVSPLIAFLYVRSQPVADAGFANGGGTRPSAEVASIEAPKAPRGWDLGSGCPLPNREGVCIAPPRKFFDFESENGDFWCILGAILAVHCSFFHGLFKAF